MAFNKKLRYYKLPLLLITIIAIGTGILDYFTPLMGDDLSKWMAMGGESEQFSLRKAISFLAANYFGCNGRIFDAVGPVLFTVLPKAVFACLIGVMTGWFFIAIAMAAGIFKAHERTIACGFITITLFSLPWWDSMFMRVCHYNYIWSSAFALYYIYFWFHGFMPKRFGHLILFSFGLLTGCFHEQTGISLCCVFTLMLIISRCQKWKLSMYIGLLFGTFLTVASPGFWRRNSSIITDSERIELIFTTVPWVVILIFITLYIVLRRNKYMNVVKTPEYITYLCTALLTSAIAIYSTVPGRTGWLAECLALVALYKLIIYTRVKIIQFFRILINSLCFIIIIIHFSVSVFWQLKMSQEYDRAMTEYQNSRNGIVRMSYTSRMDVSPLTLYRVKGLPDGDDTYILSLWERFFNPHKPLVLIDPTFNVSDSVPYPCFKVYNSIQDTITICVSPFDKQKNVVTEFEEDSTKLYLIQPLIIDPGDHWHTVDDKIQI
ncbi:MAG: hypothetical protein K2M79_02765 [Muribaculaceae bacterium]|nr:hypothetical protein [Muribaculaceae bacterium]